MDSYASRRVAIVEPFRHDPPRRVRRRRHHSSSSESEDSDWPIRRGFLRITLRDVACEHQVSRLQQWLTVFSPSGQPQSSEEHFYVSFMYRAIEERLSSFEMNK